MPKVVGYDQAVYKRITCKNCGAINEYTNNDVQDIKTGSDYLGGYEAYRGFNCAGCNKPVNTGRD